MMLLLREQYFYVSIKGGVGVGPNCVKLVANNSWYGRKSFPQTSLQSVSR